KGGWTKHADVSGRRTAAASSGWTRKQARLRRRNLGRPAPCRHQRLARLLPVAPPVQQVRRTRHMGGTGVIDRFLEVFTSYIDTGFGLLGSEVGFLATTPSTLCSPACSGRGPPTRMSLLDWSRSPCSWACSPTSLGIGTTLRASCSRASPGSD